MNTLKKGDKCQSPWGVVTVYEDQQPSAFVTPLITVTTERGNNRLIAIDELTRIQSIPSHSERMQAVLDIAWDAENRLQDDETVQLKVGAFVEFARQFVNMQDLLEMQEIDCLQLAEQCRQNAKKIKDVRKGETL